MEIERKLEDGLVSLMRETSTRLPRDVMNALKSALEGEDSDVAKAQLRALIENSELAAEERIPICQDTGTPSFYLDLGEDFPVRILRPLIETAVRRATEEIPLRPNAVNPLTGRNSGDNTGRFVPILHYDLVQGDELTVRFMPKGGGSANTSRLRMLSPGLGLRGVMKAVVDTVLEAAGKPCPPIIVGVGVGGAEDYAMKMAKKALLGPIDELNPDESVAKLEKMLLSLLNELGIGPMGLGGRTTVLGVKVEWAHRHPASLPVGVVTMCWASRRGMAHFSSDGSYRISMP